MSVQMSVSPELDTSGKALSINVNHAIYGTIAEIGAGQEVAHRFFAAGGAAGTVAKTMSAYDMKFSDEIYGPTTRYVSKDRLLSMFNHEYSLLLERIGESRGKDSTFFVFADTVSARNYKGTNECHGWMGIRYQQRPLSEPNDILLHVRMLDKSNLLQQQALGIIGVNVIYAAYHYAHDFDLFISSLADDLGTERIEVEIIQFTGPDFKSVDHREVNLLLLAKKFSSAVMFGPDQSVLQPSEVLYRKPILIQRGSFRPVTNVNVDMMIKGEQQFVNDFNLKPSNSPEGSLICLFEMTKRNLLANNIDNKKALFNLIDVLSMLGKPILVTDYPEFYRLSGYLRRYTREPIAVVLGANNLFHIFDEQYYDHLDGGILEAIGRLFRAQVTAYIYPMHRDAYLSFFKSREIELSDQEIPDSNIINADTIRVPFNLRNLYKHLRESNLIRSIEVSDTKFCGIHSSEVREKIAKGDQSWENAVPTAVAEIIKRQKLFQ